jgi:DNA-binding NarL/FixJ family response regulator
VAEKPILVIDDDRKFRRLVCNWLTRAGFSVTESEDADEALAAISRDPPALIVLDVKLPRVSGYELLRELRDRLGEQLPVVFVSGERTDAYDRIAGLLLGGDDYLVKPFDPDELVARVRRLLGPSSEPARRTSERDSDSGIDRLTSREREILALLASGRSTAEITQQLVITTRTLSTHVQHILAKLGAHSRAQAVAIAHEAKFRSDLDARLSRTT